MGRGRGVRALAGTESRSHLVDGPGVGEVGERTERQERDEEHERELHGERIRIED